jgi:hypothetical protein
MRAAAQRDTQRIAGSGAQSDSIVIHPADDGRMSTIDGQENAHDNG